MNRPLAWAGAVGFAAGLFLGWGISRPAKAIKESSAPALRQADNSLVVRRADSATGKASHLLPSGSKEIRRVQVTVQPRRGVVVHVKQTESLQVACDAHREWPDPLRIAEDSAKAWRQHGSPAVDSCDCPPVTVDLSLVRMPDKTRRVVASSPDGTVLTGVDIPLEVEREPRIPRWTLSAIALADFDGIHPGGMISRRVGPVVLGGGIYSTLDLRRPGGITQLGITW